MPATGAMSRMKLKLRFVVERRVDCVRQRDQEQRIAVRRRAHDRLGGDIAAGARPVFDDELLAEPLRQPLADQARDDVGRAAGGKADDDAHRPRRIGLRPCDRATRPGARRRPLPDAENFGGEVSWHCPMSLSAFRKCRSAPNLGRFNLRNARPPEAQPLPLISRNVGMFRRQLFAEPTPIPWTRVGGDVAYWPLADILSVAFNARFRR